MRRKIILAVHGMLVLAMVAAPFLAVPQVEAARAGSRARRAEGRAAEPRRGVHRAVARPTR